MGVLAWLNPFNKIVDGLNEAYRTKLAAKNDGERIEADKQISFFQDQMALATAAAEHDKWWSPRTLMAYGVTIYVLKLFVWDTVFGLGVTPDPGPTVNGIAMVVIGFYYGAKAVSDLGARLLAMVARR